MRTLTVTGHGSVRLVPDTAVVRVAAAFRADTLAAALAGASSAAGTVVAVGRRFTEPRRIATLDLRVAPAHDREGRRVGFDARQALRIGCADLDRAGALVEALAAEVGDRLRVESVDLEVADQAAAEAEARAAAYADARARAGHLAELAAGRLGEVQAVSEGGLHPAGGADLLLVSAAGPTFEPGESEVGAAVTVTFQLL